MLLMPGQVRISRSLDLFRDNELGDILWASGSGVHKFDEPRLFCPRDDLAVPRHKQMTGKDSSASDQLINRIGVESLLGQLWS